MTAFFITFEGPEGSGKSTQARLLSEKLRSIGMPVTLTREPGGNPVSEKIREILLHGADDSVTDRGELLLYLAARAEHTEKVVRPSLEGGSTVICGRYIDSTTAYQGYGNGIELEFIRHMNEFATNCLMPDITFLLDIDAETGLKRQRHWNRMERKAVEFHHRVRNGFLEEARLYPERIVIVNAKMSIEEIRNSILAHLKDKLKLDI
ncbi:MAG: dTMP kinase [Armatimonadota bacterium]